MILRTTISRYVLFILLMRRFLLDTDLKIVERCRPAELADF